MKENESSSDPSSSQSIQNGDSLAPEPPISDPTEVESQSNNSNTEIKNQDAAQPSTSKTEATNETKDKYSSIVQ